MTAEHGGDATKKHDPKILRVPGQIGHAFGNKTN
jgi:hypothetical protein